MIKKYSCQHCSNDLVNHRLDKIEELIDKAVLFFTFFVPFKKNAKIENSFFKHFHNLFIYLKVLEIKNDFERKKVFNRTLVLIDEAEKYNLKIRPVVRKYKNAYLNHFHFKLNNEDYYFEGLPINSNNTHIDLKVIDDKYKLKKFLSRHNLPVAEGASFITKKGGYKYGLKIGFPLVVKPRDSSLSRHVTIKINNKEKLKKAIAVVKEYTNFYLVERFVFGDLYRVSVIGNKIFAVKRLPASVVGDGQKTIKELIESKNKQPERKEVRQKNATLHKIEIDKNTLDFLAAQNLNLETILAPGQEVFVKEKVNLTSGCDIVELTNQIHPENKLLFFKLAELLKTDILGVDFICQDLFISWQEQKCAIIECNSLPYVDMHHFPSQGQPQNAAKAIIELILKK